LVAARYVRKTDFLPPAEHRRLLEHVLACEEDFEESAIIGPEGENTPDHGVRRSRTLSGARLEELWELFDRRLHALLPFVRQQLAIKWFPLGRVEWQLTAHGGGGFFAPHVDTGDAAVATRRISCVYYFHASPRRFRGGELKLYDTWVTPSGSTGAATYTALAPDDNSLVFFPSDAFHEVCPVHPESEAFADGRFAITIWLREAEGPAEGDRAAAPRQRSATLDLSG
jgi:Rps23 Pro-64 3,4-dihydroxylase Tpa1-like proline 4-hydroxylase